MPMVPPNSELSRRHLLVAAVVGFNTPRPACPDFDLWSAEHERLAALIAVTPEADEAACDRLFDRSFQLERLIMDTRSSSASAVRAKSQFLLRLMEMERDDSALAMRDIAAFIRRAT